jgi:sensor histidine kinase YesM
MPITHIIKYSISSLLLSIFSIAAICQSDNQVDKKQEIILAAETFINNQTIINVDSLTRTAIYEQLDSLNLHNYSLQLLDIEINSGKLTEWQQIERLTQMAFILFRIGKYNEAKALFTSNIQLAKNRIKRFEMVNYAGLANLLFNQSELDTALIAVNKFLVLAKAAKLENRIAEALKLKGNILFTQAAYRNALNIHLEALNYGDSLTIANTANEVSRDYFYLGIYDSAFLMSSKSMEIKRLINDTYGYCSSLGNLGQLYYYTQMHDSAINIYERCLILSKKHNYTDLEAWMYKSISNYYNRKGDYKEALRNFMSYSRLNEKLITEKSNIQFALEKAKSNAAHQQRHLQILENRNKTEKHKRIRQLYIILILALIVVIAALIIITSRLRNKKRILELRQKLSRVQMNPHFIFNSLNSLQEHILNGDIKSSNKYLTSFSKLMRNTLENTSEELIPLNQEIDFIENYIKLEAMRFNDGFNYEINIDESISIKNLMVPSMVLQPIIENAIWHGLLPKENDNKQLTIKILDNKENIVYKVIDNGVGLKEISKDLENKSLGISITQTRLKNLSKIHGKSFILTIKNLNESTNETGVIAELITPKIFTS